MTWHHIETAPKDGTEIIAFIVDSVYGGVRTVWYKDEWYGKPCDPGWMPSNLDEEYGVLVYPTHWMPLPEPPA